MDLTKRFNYENGNTLRGEKRLQIGIKIFIKIFINNNVIYSAVPLFTYFKKILNKKKTMHHINEYKFVIFL